MVRFARIKNTITLSEIEVSENLLSEVREHPDMTVLGEPCMLRFSERGELKE